MPHSPEVLQVDWLTLMSVFPLAVQWLVDHVSALDMPSMCESSYLHDSSFGWMDIEVAAHSSWLISTISSFPLVLGNPTFMSMSSVLILMEWPTTFMVDPSTTTLNPAVVYVAWISAILCQVRFSHTIIVSCAQAAEIVQGCRHCNVLHVFDLLAWPVVITFISGCHLKLIHRRVQMSFSCEPGWRFGDTQESLDLLHWLCTYGLFMIANWMIEGSMDTYGQKSFKCCL